MVYLSHRRIYSIVIDVPYKTAISGPTQTNHGTFVPLMSSDWVLRALWYWAIARLVPNNTLCNTDSRAGPLTFWWPRVTCGILGCTEARDPFYWHVLTLIPTWNSHHIHYEMWDEISFSFTNFNGATIWVWEWLSNFIPHSIDHGISYPCWD